MSLFVSLLVSPLFYSPQWRGPRNLPDRTPLDISTM